MTNPKDAELAAMRERLGHKSFDLSHRLRDLEAWGKDSAATPPTEEHHLSRLRARLDVLNHKIAVCPYWGAAVTAMNEERAGILRALAGAKP